MRLVLKWFEWTTYIPTNINLRDKLPLLGLQPQKVSCKSSKSGENCEGNLKFFPKPIGTPSPHAKLLYNSHFDLLMYKMWQIWGLLWPFWSIDVLGVPLIILICCTNEMFGPQILTAMVIESQQKNKLWQLKSYPHTLLLGYLFHEQKMRLTSFKTSDPVVLKFSANFTLPW
jgi:hypothetical protein